MTAHWHRHSVTNTPAWEQNRDVAPPTLDKYNGQDRQNKDDQHHRKYPPGFLLIEHLGNRNREARDNTRENDQRQTLIAQTVLRDQLTDPDAKHRTADHADDGSNCRQQPFSSETPLFNDRAPTQHGVEDIDLAKSGKERHRDGQDNGPFFHPDTTFAGIILHFLLQRGDYRREQLQDNLGSDIRVNTHGKHRESGYSSAR